MAGQRRIVVPFAGHAIGEGFNSETVERVGTGQSQFTSEESGESEQILLAAIEEYSNRPHGFERGKTE